MTHIGRIHSAARRVNALYSRVTRISVLVLAAIAGCGIVAMMTITCLDVIGRIFNRPIIGTLDIVKITAAVTIACALPYTTAVKGHVAIEYFFLKLSRPWRIVIDTFIRLLGMALFGLLCRQCILYGISLRRSGEVSSTLEIPLFWIPHVLAMSCAVVVLVIFHNLLHPGKETIKP